jgi:uncharacterized protein (TIGR03663 family)
MPEGPGKQAGILKTLAAEESVHGAMKGQQKGSWRSFLRPLGTSQWACWLGLLAVALALRFFFLDARPPHHDEAIHGHFAWELLHRSSYRYDPTYHGPLQYFLLAGLFALFGESDVVLRSLSALCGSLLVLVPWLLAKRVGSLAALSMGLLLAFSPTFLYYSRFARNDVPVAAFTACALALLWRHDRKPAPVLPWVAFFLALHATAKETIYVYGFLWLLAGLATAFWVGLGRSRQWLGQLLGHRQQIGLALAVFLGLCLLFYTAFFSWPQDVLFPVKAIAYWYGQHKVQRVGGPWYYHLPRLALYEFLILGLALAGAWRRRRKLTPVERFLLLWGFASLACYAYLGEKVPWLAVHQLLPWVPLAGNQLAFLWSRSGHGLGKSLSLVGGVATLWSSLACTYLYPTIEPRDPHAELLVFVQTTEEEKLVAQRGLEWYRSHDGPLVAAVTGEGVWPLSWQWKGLPVQWSLPVGEKLPPLVVADPGQVEALPLRENFRCETIPLRAWWVEQWEGVKPWQVLRWFFTRKAWSERGSTDVVVCQRQEVQR